MKKNLSLAFGTDRTYLTLIENQPNGLALKYASVTSQAFDIENFDSPFNKEALQELIELIENIKLPFDYINISIPIETAFVSKFPGRPNISTKEILSIVNIEIRQLYPQYDPSEFPTYIFRLPELNKIPYYLAVIIPKKIYQNTKKITSAINRLAEKIELSQFNSHYSMLYNYPEFFDKHVALFNIQDNFIDFSTISGKNLLSYDLLKFSSPEELPNTIKESIIKINTENGVPVEIVFLFGYGLNREIFDLISNTLSKVVKEIKRLNAFRMFRSEVNYSLRELCSTFAHLFPPCVGASISSYHEKIKIF